MKKDECFDGNGNRVVTEELSDGSIRKSTYNLREKLIKEENGDKTILYDYDIQGRLTCYRDNTGFFRMQSYIDDRSDKVESVIFSSGATEFHKYKRNKHIKYMSTKEGFCKEIETYTTADMKILDSMIRVYYNKLGHIVKYEEDQKYWELLSLVGTEKDCYNYLYSDSEGNRAMYSVDDKNNYKLREIRKNFISG
jgi:YD repeat-containing protein